MPVTRWEQDPAGASARGERLSEPPLHRLRGSLVGTRYEFLKTAAFSAVFTVSLCMIAGGAGLLSPGNQFYANARAALHGLAGNAASGAGSVSGQIQVAAASAAHGVTDRVSGLIAGDGHESAPRSPSSAGAATANPALHTAAPAVIAPAALAGHHAAEVGVAAHKLARHRHRGAEPAAPVAAPSPAPAPQQATAWSLDTLADGLSDEFSKAYYGIVSFLGDGLPSAGNSARSGLNSFTQLIGLDSESASFDPSHPETIFEILTSTSTLIMLLGVVLFLIIAGVFVISVKDGLRNMSRRLRVKRSGGYA